MVAPAFSATNGSKDSNLSVEDLWKTQGKKATVVNLDDHQPARSRPIIRNGARFRDNPGARFTTTQATGQRERGGPAPAFENVGASQTTRAGTTSNASGWANVPPVRRETCQATNDVTDRPTSKAIFIKEKDLANPTNESRRKLLQMAYDKTSHETFKKCLGFILDNYSKCCHVIDNKTGLFNFMSSPIFEPQPNAPDKLIDAVWNTINGEFMKLSREFFNPSESTHPPMKRPRMRREENDIEGITHKTWQDSIRKAAEELEVRVNSLVAKLRHQRDVPKEKSHFLMYCEIYLRISDRPVIEGAYEKIHGKYKEDLKKKLKEFEEVVAKELRSEEETSTGVLIDLDDPHTNTNDSSHQVPVPKQASSGRKRSAPTDELEEGEIISDVEADSKDDDEESIHIGITDDEDEGDQDDDAQENVQNCNLQNSTTSDRGLLIPLTPVRKEFKRLSLISSPKTLEVQELQAVRDLMGTSNPNNATPLRPNNLHAGLLISIENTPSPHSSSASSNLISFTSPRPASNLLDTSGNARSTGPKPLTPVPAPVVDLIETPFGKFEKKPKPKTEDLVFDSKLGYFVDTVTDMVYDKKTNSYHSRRTKEWYFYSTLYECYIPIKGGDEEAKKNLRTQEMCWSMKGRAFKREPQEEPEFIDLD